ncbi:hypothetical protein [Microcoleus sp. Pol10D4]|uniref:hypothetical protein n=1 Tax=Microcoleus sp. Pol10D4 TaxID=3055387 RepID=UPI002FCF0F46
MTTKDLLEIILFAITGGSALATGGFTLATLRAESRMDSKLEFFQTEIDDMRKFEQKAKQNINHSLVEVGLIKTAIRDIKTVLKMQRSEALPEENKPPRTDFT